MYHPIFDTEVQSKGCPRRFIFMGVPIHPAAVRRALELVTAQVPPPRGPVVQRQGAWLLLLG